MLPFEFIVTGPPTSYQTRYAKRLQAWKQTVRMAALHRWPKDIPPLKNRLKLTVCYYHDGVSVTIDNDNMVKPIQDALIGLVYEDDRQLTDIQVRKTDINGKFYVRGMSPILAEGFINTEEFVFVRVELAPSHEEFL